MHFFYSITAFCQQYQVIGKVNYLKLELQAATADVPAVNKLTCKTMNSTLIKHRNSSPPTAEKRLKECHFDTDERHKIYSLPFLVTKEIKLSMFQYKVIHNMILYTNSMLYKMKKVESPYCPFCTNINQTVSHLFTWCRFAATFWSHFIEWYHASTKKNSQPLQERNHVCCIEQLVILFNP